MLFEHLAQLDGHRLPARERDRHVRDEPPNIARELPIGGVTLRECFGMAEIGTPDRLLPSLNVPAPITRGRGLRL